MRYILLAPHPDDEALFASFIVMRYKPRVVVVTNGDANPSIPPEMRMSESIMGMDAIGSHVEFLELSESTPENEFKDALQSFVGPLDGTFFAPYKQGGHRHHDWVYDVVSYCKRSAIYYSTYSKQSLKPQGQLAIIPTEDEIKFKDLALSKYESQLKLNREHFEAVRGEYEYLNI